MDAVRQRLRSLAVVLDELSRIRLYQAEAERLFRSLRRMPAPPIEGGATPGDQEKGIKADRRAG